MKDKPAMKSKPTTTADDLPPIGDLGELPRSYNTDIIFLVAQEPHWLFTYWDIDIALHPGGRTCLRVMEDGDPNIQEIEVPFETKNWHIPVAKSGTAYTVEIGYYRATTWHVLAHSQSVATPRDHISDSEKFDYAMVPLHLSFDRLIHNIESAVGKGEDLVQALTRLQKDGAILAESTSSPGGLNSEELTILEALLGKELLAHFSSGGLTSQEWREIVLQHLHAHEGASEVFSGGISSLSPEMSSFVHAIAPQTDTSSWTPAMLSSWAITALTSWATVAPDLGGASWLAGPESSSWNASGLSSWLQGGTTSWPGVELSSGSYAGLTSWSEAVLSSWGPADTSSWGGSENVGSFGFATRDFFLHVNAEVIFYGGTDPRAQVTIDGKPVRLNPDGSFRHHFIFPDGRSEIPIVATSPDGVEQRSAILRFQRETTRHGHVGHTAQPWLPVPFGTRA